MAADVGYVEEQQPSTQYIGEITKIQVVTEEPKSDAKVEKSKPRVISNKRVRSPDKQLGDEEKQNQSKEDDSKERNPTQKTDSNTEEELPLEQRMAIESVKATKRKRSTDESNLECKPRKELRRYQKSRQSPLEGAMQPKVVLTQPATPPDETGRQERAPTPRSAVPSTSGVKSSGSTQPRRYRASSKVVGTGPDGEVIYKSVLEPIEGGSDMDLELPEEVR
ncbi:hypothetical protein RF55_15753 [Lasius niger]|uniref:Uncharacterized protein n=1 Tax=Lasius niger TaxID=67767 RepID=A0A0J7MYT8_LASNI|nr:hypothetical protein RF55_15753 [Lasius niger]